MMQGFYVYNVTDHTAPRFLHSEIWNAEQEAERLARANPGKIFQVLALTGQVKACALEWDRVAPF